MKHGLNPSDITPLTRLTMLSQDRIGGLRFEPFKSYCISETIPNLNLLYNEAREIMLNNDSQMSIEEFFIQGRSSNGARPKIGVKDSEGSWIVKLPSVYDTKDMGTMEYDYNQAAEECSIEVPEFKLFTSSQCKGFLLQKDSTDQAQDKYMVSASGLLETSHRTPAMDYMHLFKLS